MSYKKDVRLIKALADENRLAILDLLQSGEKCAYVLLAELRITQPTLSHHMKVLCDAGIVDSCKDGKWMHYSISLEGSKMFRNMMQRYTMGETDFKNYRTCDSFK